MRTFRLYLLLRRLHGKANSEFVEARGHAIDTNAEGPETWCRQRSTCIRPGSLWDLHGRRIKFIQRGQKSTQPLVGVQALVALKRAHQLIPRLPNVASQSCGETPHLPGLTLLPTRGSNGICVSRLAHGEAWVRTQCTSASTAS